MPGAAKRIVVAAVGPAAPKSKRVSPALGEQRRWPTIGPLLAESRSVTDAVASQTHAASSSARVAAAVELMDGYAERTGVGGDPSAGGPRYLWTDAFAVMTDLALGEKTGEDRFRRRGRALIDDVHRRLGRHRDDDARAGPISGVDEASAVAHPTKGGLRIGKPRPERGPGEALDPELEWERDGQYFHYLTKWMLALDRAARACAEPELNVWACELAYGTRDAFVQAQDTTPPRLVWKMSIDLSRTLVDSTGQHDALEGWVTFRQLEATRRHLGTQAPALDSREAIFAQLLDFDALATSDPLGIGSLLLNVARLEQIRAGDDFASRRLMEASVSAISDGIDSFLQRGDLTKPAEDRLAFRELGLAIGLSTLDLVEGRLHERADDHRDAVLRDLVEPLVPFTNLGRSIESFWREPVNQASSTWQAHANINEVMLATSLVPEGATNPG